MAEILLDIQNLHASIAGKKILNGINLTIKAGETHALMGPNGAGKSTLSAVLAGHPNYTVTQGFVSFKGKDLLALTPDQRACEGLFLGFQLPTEIPGINLTNFLKTALNAKYKYNNQKSISTREFLTELKKIKSLLDFDEKFDNRSLNEGFSGGEKKKNEILQMAMLHPSLSILDELDSGLDIDALKIVTTAVNKLKNNTNALLLITHYQRLLDYLIPDFIHIIENGIIVKTGDASLAAQLELSGYKNIIG